MVQPIERSFPTHVLLNERITLGAAQVLSLRVTVHLLARSLGVRFYKRSNRSTDVE